MVFFSLPVLTYFEYAPLRVSKTTIFAPARRIFGPVGVISGAW